MDMNDILAQWSKVQEKERNKQKESGKNQVSHKKANAPTKEEKELAKAKQANYMSDFDEENNKQINPMELWLRRYGTVDKDKMLDEREERMRQNDRNHLRTMRIEERLDLHGLRQEDAEIRLNNFISSCKQRGIRKVLIVHGKGIHTTGTDPVLGELVRKFIERDPRLGMSGHPDRNMGGNGATWVIIK